MDSQEIETIVLSDSDADGQDAADDTMSERKWWSVAELAQTTMDCGAAEVDLPVTSTPRWPDTRITTTSKSLASIVTPSPIFANVMKDYKIPKRKILEDPYLNDGRFKRPKPDVETLLKKPTASASSSSTPAVDIVKKILELCCRLANDNIDKKIVNKMEKKMSRCDQAYKASSAFVQFATGIHDNIIRDPTKRHLHLKELYDEMTSLKSNEVGGRGGVVVVKDEKPTTSSAFDLSSNQVDDAGSSAITKKIDLKIRRLEKHYKCCQKKIDKLESREMSLDDLDDDQSDYILLHRYKQRVLEIWNKLCELNGRKKKTGRLIEKKFSYTGTRYEVINNEVTAFMKHQKFPDFADILDIVNRCNEDHPLHLRISAIHQTAKDIFEDIGKELKRRRIADYEEHYGCPNLDENYEANDPANQNPDLLSQFAAHKEIAMVKMEEIFLSYQRKQLEQEQEPSNDANAEDEEGEATEDDEKSSSNDEEEEEEDEDEDEGDQEDQFDIANKSTLPMGPERSSSTSKPEDQSSNDSGSLFFWEPPEKASKDVKSPPVPAAAAAKRENSASRSASTLTAMTENPSKEENDSKKKSTGTSANLYFWDPRDKSLKPIKPPPRVVHVLPTVKPVVRVPQESTMIAKPSAIAVKRLPIKSTPFVRRSAGGADHKGSATSEDVEVIVLE